VEGGSGGSKGLNGGLPALFLGDGEGFIQSGKQHQAPAKSKQRRVIALHSLRSDRPQIAMARPVPHPNRVNAQTIALTCGTKRCTSQPF
jgi:hypothetical protein